MRLRYFVILALLAPLLPGATGSALAGPRDDVMSASSRCAGIADDRAWLDCYYGAAQPMRAQLGLVPAPASQTAQVPPPPAGMRAASAPPPAPRPQAAAAPADRGFIGSLFGSGTATTTLASYRYDKNGIFTATLANGEVWQQLPDDVNIAHWREAGSKYRVSVVQHYGRTELIVDNDGQTYQVRRVN